MMLWRLVVARLRRQLPGERVEPILTDLREDYDAHRRTSGALHSAWWLLSESRSLAVAYRVDRSNRRRRDGRRGFATVEALWRDARGGWRSLRHTPAATAAVALTLAMGIGANTAIFAVVNGVLLEPLPYPDADRLISVAHRSPGSSVDIPSAPYLYFTFRDTADTLESIGLWQTGNSTVTGLGRPEQVQALYVTHEIVPLLGIAPLAGRTFTDRDDVPNAPVAVLLTWGYWQRRFGGDTSVIGQQLEIDSMPATIVGILPARFRFLDRPIDVIYPFQLDPALVTLGRYTFQSLARLKPGVTLTSATADLSRVVPIAIDRFPPPPGYTRDRFARQPVVAQLTPIREAIVGDIGQTLWIVMGALGVVLVIACANVAHLLLVRADGRRRELAVRIALGAAPSRIVVGLLVEGVLLGLLGGAAGVAVACFGLPALLALAPATLPRAQDIGIDPLVFVFAIALSLLSGLWLGVVPSLKLTRRRDSLTTALVEGGRTTSDGRARQRARGVLVVVQVALAMLLLIGSGLMIRTFQALMRVDPGFTRPEQIQLVYIAANLPDADQTTRTQRAIIDAFAAIPGVTAVAFKDRPPLGANNRGGDTVLTVQGAKPLEGQPRPLRRFQFISPGYFETLGTPLVAGRDLTWSDLHDTRPVAIVSARLAHEEWGSAANALGGRVQVTPTDPWREVVGVAGDLRDNGMQEPPPPIIYFPARLAGFWGTPQMSIGAGTFAIRSARAGTESFVREIEQAVARVNPNFPVAEVRQLSDVYRASMARTSFTLTILLVAGTMGLGLGVIGIYGVVAYAVSQRTHEIGIRLALGAQPGEVTRLVQRRGLALAAIGLTAGLAAALLLTRVMSSLLVGVSALDPITYAAAAVLVLLVVGCAAYVPARRASRRGAFDALRRA